MNMLSLNEQGGWGGARCGSGLPRTQVMSLMYILVLLGSIQLALIFRSHASLFVIFPSRSQRCTVHLRTFAKRLSLT